MAEDGAGHLTEDGVVFQKVGERCRVSEVIGGYELDVGIVKSSTDNIPPDTAEAVNSYSGCHRYFYFTGRPSPGLPIRIRFSRGS